MVTHDPREVNLDLFTDAEVQKALWVMDSLGLDAFRIYLDRATSVDLPYHNKYHTACMINECERLANQQNLSEYDMRLLLTAAAFHDFNHTGGKSTDVKNIELALEAFHKYSDKNPTVEKLICVTQYPFVREPLDPSVEITKMMQIIRDCDLMQSFRPTWFVHVILGLRAESFPDADVKDLVKKNFEFVLAQKFYTIDRAELDYKLTRLEKGSNYLLTLMSF